MSDGFLKTPLAGGVAVPKGETFSIVTRQGDYLWVRFRSGVQRIIHRDHVEETPFVPGLFRLVDGWAEVTDLHKTNPDGTLASRQYGPGDVRWFDKDPGGHWEKI